MGNSILCKTLKTDHDDHRYTYIETTTGTITNNESRTSNNDEGLINNTFAGSSSSVISKAMLPDPTLWQYRPLFIENKLINEKHKEERDIDQVPQSCPIGIPFDFETDLFKGKALIRMRGLESSEDIEGNKNYFHGRKRKSQTVIQGKFKDAMNYADVQIGREYELPLKQPPPYIINSMIKQILRRVSPAIEVELCGEKPKVLSTLAESAQILRKDVPGKEPDITSIDLKENNELGISSKKRKKYFTYPKKASNHIFDTDHIYTFECYDDSMDYKEYTMNIVIMNYDMANTLNGQPFQVMAKNKKLGKHLYLFNIMHEHLLPPGVG